MAECVVIAIDADVEFVNCTFSNNLVSGSFEQGSTVVMDGGTIALGSSGNGFILSQSEMGTSGVTLSVATGAASWLISSSEVG